jgi:hypothetical protein
MVCDYNIELAMKRRKSLIHIDKLRTKQRSKLAEVYLYSKIIYQLIVEHDMRTMFGFMSHFGDVGRGLRYSVHLYRGGTHCQP